MNNVSAISERFQVADIERKIWSGGRIAFREVGRPDTNPFAPETPEHDLWMDGFEHEETQRRHRWRELLEAPL